MFSLSYFKVSFLILAFIISTTKVVLCFSASATTNNCTVTDYNEIKSILKNCTDIVFNDLLVPAGKELTLDIRNGSTITFRGNISFGQKHWTGPLVHINGANFVMKGDKGSFFDGNGPFYWDGRGNAGPKLKPKFVKINAVNAVIENIKLFNCPIVCVMIRGAENLIIKNWEIDNLEGDVGVVPLNKSAHNTDGFTVATSRNLLIDKTVVYNQDDCVVLSSGQNITVSNIFCHGSHGLSIKGIGEVLENVLFVDSVITNAENGIHVKAQADSPPGLVKNITYKNIRILDSIYYGINVQQNYRGLDSGEPMDDPPTNNVKLYNLNFDNVYGNVQNGAVPIFILCAEEGCFDWDWKDVKIWGAKKNNCTGYVPKGNFC